MAGKKRNKIHSSWIKTHRKQTDRQTDGLSRDYNFKGIRMLFVSLQPNGTFTRGGMLVSTWLHMFIRRLLSQCMWCGLRWQNKPCVVIGNKCKLSSKDQLFLRGSCFSCSMHPSIRAAVVHKTSVYLFVQFDAFFLSVYLSISLLFQRRHNRKFVDDRVTKETKRTLKKIKLGKNTGSTK